MTPILRTTHITNFARIPVGAALTFHVVSSGCVPPPPSGESRSEQQQTHALADESTPQVENPDEGASSTGIHAEVAEEPEVDPAFEPPAPILPGGPPATTEHVPIPPKPSDEARHKPMIELGREAFEALTAGDAEHLLRLTPARKTSIQKACPAYPVADTKAIEAAFKHCHESIDFDAIKDVRVGASAESQPEPASGCDDGVMNLGRLQILVITTKGDWQIDLLDTFGGGGPGDKAFGFGGGFRCKKIPPSP